MIKILLNSIEMVVHKYKILCAAPFYLYLCSFFLSCKTVSPQVARKSNDFWAFSTLFMMKLFFVKNIRVHYHPKIMENRKLIFLCNHVNNIDWFVTWMTFTKLEKENLYLCAKKSLILYSKLFKIINNYKVNFVLLDRNINTDYINLVKSCHSINKLDEYVAILFPEGTLFSRPRNSLINMQRCKRRNYATFKNVMMPKTRGFSILCKNLESCDGIVDCTLRYSNRVNLINFLLGRRCTIDVYLDYKEKPPVSESEQWLINVYADKDDKIETDKLHDKNFLNFEVSYPKRIYYLLTLSIPWLYKKSLDFVQHPLSE